MQYRNDTMAADDFCTFWFEKNLQGDVVAVYNSSGTKCVSYTYDTWGNVIPNSVNTSGTNDFAKYNPFTYRGYYYDSEMGLYYLNSRYYDPATGRFINADGQLNDGLLGFNQFSYCENNPITRIDFDGYSSERNDSYFSEVLPVGAYLVVYYNQIPVAGHAALFYRDSDNWYLTQVTGSDFQIATGVIESSIVISSMTTTGLPMLTLAGMTAGTVVTETVKNDEIMIRMSAKTNNYEMIPLYGDFSYISSLVPTGSHTMFYSLFYNNCATYIGDLLKASGNRNLVNAVENQFVPSIMLNRVKAAQNRATNLQIGYIGGRSIARREIK